MSSAGLLDPESRVNLVRHGSDRHHSTNSDFEQAQEIALTLRQQALTFLNGLLRPWNAYQVLIIIGMILAAWAQAHVLAVNSGLSERR